MAVLWGDRWIAPPPAACKNMKAIEKNKRDMYVN